MIRAGLVLALSVVVATAGWSVWAAESEGLSGTVGAEAVLLPGFSSGVWLDLSWNVNPWVFGALTHLVLFPGFTASWTGTVAYSLGPVDLGGTLAMDVYPLDLVGLDLLARAGLIDWTRDDDAASVEASFLCEVLPALAGTLSLDADASYGRFTAWGDLDLGVPGFGVTVLAGAEICVLDLDLDDGQLTGDLGARATVVPTFDAQFWFDVSFELGAFEVTADTEFDLTPFGLAEQRIQITIRFDGVSVYAWGGFDGAGDVTAGIGGCYDFP